MDKTNTLKSDSLQPNIYCNRTLNLNNISAIGYDMDYTLVDYCVEAWEEEAFDHVKFLLEKQFQWPIKHLKFDASLTLRGLVIDRERGNLLKIDRFGLVRRAQHGTTPLTFRELKKAYGNVTVDLSEPRYIFLNELFSLSESCMYTQLVDQLDEHTLSHGVGYWDLYDKIRFACNEAHLQGHLKGRITSNPERYVQLAPQTAQALLDQYHANKKLLLITNSEWPYTTAMMQYSIERYLPKSMQWRDLFTVVIASARKPLFFNQSQPLYRIVNADGLLEPCHSFDKNHKCYIGGDASQVEQFLGVQGQSILYVGDHIYGDVLASKKALRWRTALILRELDTELSALEQFRETEKKLELLMQQKGNLENQLSKLHLQRLTLEQDPQNSDKVQPIVKSVSTLRNKLTQLDQQIRPLAAQATSLNNPRWGLVLRAGNNKSFIAHQVERYADAYMATVAAFRTVTPFAYLRAKRTALPHETSLYQVQH